MVKPVKLDPGSEKENINEEGDVSTFDKLILEDTARDTLANEGTAQGTCALNYTAQGTLVAIILSSIVPNIIERLVNLILLPIS